MDQRLQCKTQDSEPVIGKIFQDIYIGKDFLNKTRGSLEIIVTTDKCVRFFSLKDGVQGRDRNRSTVEKRFTRTENEGLEGKPQAAHGK